MNLKNITKYTNNINFSHLYFEESILNSLNTYKEYFNRFISIDLFTNPTLNDKSHIIFIEVNSIDKKSFKILTEIVKKNISKEIVIFTPDVDNTFLLKFAIYYGVKKILPLKDDKEILEKNIITILKNLHLQFEKKSQVEVSKNINSFFSFFILKKGILIFANENAKEMFEENNLSELELTLKNNNEISSLISKEKTQNQEIMFELENGEKWIYNFFLNILPKSEDKLLIIVPSHKVVEEEAFLSALNRFKFIEILKDRLNQNINSKNMNLMFINIVNYEKLIKSCSSILVHNFIKSFIELLFYHKDTNQDVTQWSPHCFIFLNEGLSFKKFKSKLESIHKNLIYNEINSDIVPIINSSALDITEMNINEIITKIEIINDHNFQAKDIDRDTFFELHHLSDYVDDNEQIHHYMQNCISNKSNIKLLNIYKGLCINTTSSVLKISDESYFVKCESLQGYSMQFENKTVIQTPDLQNDILADIVYVNIEKSYAVLDNLQFLNFSANNRQHTRVQPNFRTPITLRISKNSYQGEILDISTKALAMKFNNSLSSDIIGSIVEIDFKLPDEDISEGFSTIKVEGEILFVCEFDINKSKVVVNLILEKPYDSYLSKYMYTRQKELIGELKKITRLNKKRA